MTDFETQIADKVYAVQHLKEMNLLTEDELHILYAGIREDLALPPRDFKAERNKE